MKALRRLMEPDNQRLGLRFVIQKKAQGKFSLRFSLECGINNYWQGMIPCIIRMDSRVAKGGRL